VPASAARSPGRRLDLWLGPTCHRDHRLFGGVWCECSPWPSPIDRERGFWGLSEEERRRCVALYDYDERFRSVREDAETSGRDLTIVEIERGLKTPAELATILTLADLKAGPGAREAGRGGRKRSRARRACRDLASERPSAARAMMRAVVRAFPLLERPTYGIAEVDRLLGLKAGTARRWIDGYERGRRRYPPIVRLETTGEELVTWGEFVETRLLAEYREQGALIFKMRPAVERLREELGVPYPLAHAAPFLDVAGRELVRRIQEDVKLESALRLVLVRNDQAILTPESETFARSADYGETRQYVERIFPSPDLRQVVFDPLRRSGKPVVRSVPTEVIAEQFRAGDPISSIAEAYELAPTDVEAAIRYELQAAGSDEAA
jgi:uncharacterized protein (DUF433 family)